jgi:hypothetical protein
MPEAFRNIAPAMQAPFSPLQRDNIPHNFFDLTVSPIKTPDTSANNARFCLLTKIIGYIRKTAYYLQLQITNANPMQ